MANYAALIDVLSVAGSRLTDGSANASGNVWFFQPGTNTPVNVYSDAAATAVVTQPVVLTSGGLLSTATFPNGIYATQPVRLYIEDVNGTAVSDTTYIPATAGDVGVSNAGFTDSTLDAVLTEAFTSFGGQDWKYKESGGATERTIQSKFSEIWISVKDFGAVGDGIAIDTTAIQNAVNRVIALGGGVVYFPAGTYIIDQAISITSGVALRIVGIGSRGTIIQSTHATANVFTFATAATNCSVENLRIQHATATSGAAVSVANGTDFIIDNVNVISSDFDYGFDFSGASNWKISGSQVSGLVRGIRSNTSGSIRMSYIYDSIVGQSGHVGLELNGNDGGYRSFGSFFIGTTGILINSAYTGSDIGLFGNQFANTTAIDMTGLAVIPNIRQWGNSGLYGSATSGATGAAQTPSLVLGREVILSATSGGAGTVTVNAPASLPGTGTDAADLYWDFVFKNAAAGAVTWSLNAVFVVASAIPTTDGHTIGVRFRWDRSTSKLREVSRADTVT